MGAKSALTAQDVRNGAHCIPLSSPSYPGIPLILRDRLPALACQQEGLRRVATLVARGGSRSEVFTAVAEEMARCLHVENADVFR
jgi:hypothetical protein